MNRSSGNIISASRRTDIPAFYSAWFMGRLRAGFVEVANPFNPLQISRVSLLPAEVIAIVFWTRNPLPLLPHLDTLNSMGFRYYFQFTLNNFPRVLESTGPAPVRMIETMHKLARRLTPRHVQWRYDPIVLSDITPVDWHVQNFSHLAHELRGATTRCYFSFVDFYKKTTRNLRQLEPEVQVIAPQLAQQVELVAQFQKIADMNDLTLYACCEDHLLAAGRVQKAHCVDLGIIYELFPEVADSVSGLATRKECGCFASKDIGAYDSCLFRCAYCYANADFAQKSLPRFARHDSSAAMLIP